MAQNIKFCRLLSTVETSPSAMRQMNNAKT